jgi:ABC-type polysaccharide/polyol phosphate export permease
MRLCWLRVLLAVLAYFVAALAPSMDVANAALPVYVSTLLYFGGFLFTFSTMPPWWKWYSYINPLRYMKQHAAADHCCWQQYQQLPVYNACLMPSGACVAV